MDRHELRSYRATRAAGWIESRSGGRRSIGAAITNVLWLPLRPLSSGNTGFSAPSLAPRVLAVAHHERVRSLVELHVTRSRRERCPTTWRGTHPLCCRRRTPRAERGQSVEVQDSRMSRAGRTELPHSCAGLRSAGRRTGSGTGSRASRGGGEAV